MNPEEKLRYQSRIWLFYALVVVLVMILLSGLAYRQILQNDVYFERGKIQNHRRILTPGPRGNIYDREGRLIVSNKSKFSAVVFLADASVRRSFRQEYYGMKNEFQERGEKFDSNRLQIEARGNVIQSYLDDVNRMLGRETSINASRVSQHFNMNPLLPYPLIDDLNREELAVLLELLPIEHPIQIYASHTRHYPYENSAAHLLGYVRSSLLEPEKDLKGGDLRTFSTKGTFGDNGIEKEYDHLLQGKTGMEIWVVDPAGFQVERVQKQPPVTGKDLHLSIDMDLQRIVEQQFEVYDSKGAFVAIDIETMEVLAMVSKPDYDLNDTAPFLSFTTAKDIGERGAWQNKAMQGLFAPGSPFKLLTAVAGLKAGVIDDDTVINCPGFLRVGRRNFPCHNRAGHGDMDLEHALSSSCNVFFYTVALQIGIDNLSSEAIFLGMDQPTKIDLPFETNGMLVPTKQWKQERKGQSWYQGDTANTAIGQGFLLFSPLQMAVMAASIGTNQVLSYPSVLKRTSEDLDKLPIPRSLGLPEEDHQLILDGMKLAATSGSARFLQELKGEKLPLGGKTGTAQVRVKGGTLEMAWIVALAPIDDPKVAIAIVVEGEEVGASHGGGSVAAPMAKPFFQEYFNKHPELLPAVEEQAAPTTASNL
ncbi:hypothetical protein MLD52_11355 [Puniceicoccaceae bacterium K14]|nr:hypothetical protein [Puniceicoccaceae bacterium K14]